MPPLYLVCSKKARSVYNTTSCLLQRQRTSTNISAHTGEWRIQSPHDPNDHAFLFIAWLEEILYKAEVHNQWLVDVQCKVEERQDGLEIVAHVEWVDADSVEREIEIKAVTTHQLTVSEVERGAIIVSDWPDVPTFEGPGWYADVVFDI